MNFRSAATSVLPNAELGDRNSFKAMETPIAVALTNDQFQGGRSRYGWSNRGAVRASINTQQGPAAASRGFNASSGRGDPSRARSTEGPEGAGTPSVGLRRIWRRSRLSTHETA